VHAQASKRILQARGVKPDVQLGHENPVDRFCWELRQKFKNRQSLVANPAAA